MTLQEYYKNYQIFEHNKMIGLRNIKTHEEIIPAENNMIHILCPFYADQVILLKVKTQKKYYLYDIKGNKITEGMDYIGDYNYGIARFLKGNKYGFFDSEGGIFISPKYEKAEKIDYGKYKVKFNDRWGVVDYSGEIVKLEYDNVYLISGKLYGKKGTTYVRLHV